MDTDNLSAIAAQYEVVCTLHTQGASPIERILEANPRRWYVEFWWDPSFFDVQIGPTGSQSVLSATFAPPGMPVAYKFRDCPAFLAGEWYALAPPGRLIYTFECVYLR